MPTVTRDNAHEYLNLDEWMLVRGVPVLKSEVIYYQEKLEAQLFDEGVFPKLTHKQACANVIRFLDEALKRWQVAKGQGAILPEYLDIGDPAWFYIPVGFQGYTVVATRDKPAGVVAWYRRKRYFAVRNPIKL
jgi:hypothetical protein